MTSRDIYINEMTSFLAVDTSLATINTVNLPYVPSYIAEGRLLYIKDSDTTSPNAINLVPPVGGFLYASSIFSPNLYQKQSCAIVQNITTNSYSLLNCYPNYSQIGLTVLPEAPGPTSVAVTIPGTRSILFPDLTTQSKALLLPLLTTLTNENSKSPYFLIKDVDGNANARPFYISTTGGAYIDSPAITTLGFHANFASIELTGDRARNCWHVLSYFNGERLPSAPAAPPYTTAPEFYISTSASVIHADMEFTRKKLYLPSATSCIGKSIWIHDLYGTCSAASSIQLEVKSGSSDTIDGTSIPLLMSTFYQTVRLTGTSPTNFAITLSYTGLIP